MSASDGMKDLWSDISGMCLDKVLESVAKDQDLLREIPIIKWIGTSIGIKNSIQSAAFIKKYSNFIGQIHLGSFNETDLSVVADAVDVPAVTDEIVENTMIYLD